MDRYEKKYVKLVLVGIAMVMQGKAASGSLISYPGMSRINSILGPILQ